MRDCGWCARACTGSDAAILERCEPANPQSPRHTRGWDPKRCANWLSVFCAHWSRLEHQAQGTRGFPLCRPMAVAWRWLPRSTLTFAANKQWQHKCCQSRSSQTRWFWPTAIFSASSFGRLPVPPVPNWSGGPRPIAQCRWIRYCSMALT